MKIISTKIVGWLLVLIGVLVAASSEQIIFAGLERLVGLERIVGKENVVYQPYGGYFFTNPGAMIRWGLSVRAIGILICVSGGLVLLRARRAARKISDGHGF